ncbi:helix-turn-helix domain-containing protein [Paenibacillus donghaensis]|nr:helix-turn-helix transcriptional regulator [Paenibacillus donghaensis]
MSTQPFGEYLRQLRNAKGMTLQDVKDASGVSHPYLSQLENGKKCVVSPDVVRKLAAAFGVTHLGLMIKAGHVTEDEVLTFRREHGINDGGES